MRKLVIIPTFNESENIAAIIKKVLSLDGDFDILVVDDGSPDGTADIVKNLIEQTKGRIFILERSGKLGLGTAYITGFRWALENKYDYIFEMDADFSHNPEDLINLYNEAHQNNKDLVIGSRYITGVNVVNWPMQRLLLSFFASKYVRIVTGMRVKDATAGFICYSARFLSEIDLSKIKMKGYGFQIEMKYTAWRLKYNMSEVSIIFTERREGQSKMSGNILKEALWGVMGLRFRKIKKLQ
ncbi:MAG: polyprenol monophosphomannose synthase [Rikenellaceae bacterium]